MDQVIITQGSMASKKPRITKKYRAHRQIEQPEQPTISIQTSLPTQSDQNTQDLISPV